MSRRKFFVLFLAFFMIISAFPCPVLASDSTGTDEQVVKVGIYEYPLYAEQDSSGIWIGYDAEMSESIAQEAGFSIEFVPVTTMDEVLKDLDDGTIDIAGNMLKTPEGEEKYLFSDYEQGSTSISIIVKKDNDTTSYGDTEEMSRLKFGVPEGSVYQAFLDWCSEKEFTPDITEYSSSVSILPDLDSGKVDAAVISDDSAEGGKYRSVQNFDLQSYYYMFRKDSTDLKNRFNNAAAKIFMQNPLYEQSLKQKYGIYSATTASFTKVEKEYIAANPDTTVAVVENDDPYYHSGNDGKPYGILPEFYEKVSEYTGLKFTFRPYGSQKEASDAVLSGEADVLGIYSDGLPYAMSDGLRLTASFSTVSLVMICRSGTDTENIKKIAVKKRSFEAVKNSISSEFANAEFVGCNSSKACFTALKGGSADALIVALPSATWIINQTASNAYSFIPLSGSGLEVDAATAADSGLLADIMSKGIRQASYLFNGIIANNTGSENTLQTFISRIPARAIVIAAAVTLLIVVFLIGAVFSLIRSRKVKIAAMRTETAAVEQRIRAEAIEKNAIEKNTFFSNISHDMRTPLNGILGFADLAGKQDTLEGAKKYIDKIKVSGKLLLDLINDTLTISKIGNGKLVLKNEPVDTELLTEGIEDSIQSLASQKNIEFIVDESGLRRRIVLGDRLNLEKIFLNLLSNAVKFTPEGGHVRFTVRDDPQTAGSAKSAAGEADPDIVVTVSDDGIGMSSEYQRHMFEPFSQEKRHGYDSVGTGLGLSIVHNLVELMNGKIEVKSRTGQGTEFTVRLRLKEVPNGIIHEGKKKEFSGDSLLAGKKILLCEDNALNREIAAALLNDKGMKVGAAENGREGLRTFSESGENEYSAVLMDIRMPVMDGLETAKEIRSLERTDAKTVPIIAMTADVFEEDIEKCRKAGMDGHIAKPIDPQEMYRVLEEKLT